MPVTFVFDNTARAVFTTAAGIVSYEELMEHIEAKRTAGVMECPELFDAREINLDLSSLSFSAFPIKSAQHS